MARGKRGEVQAWLAGYVSVVTPESGCTDWPWGRRHGRAAAFDTRIQHRMVEAGKVAWQMLHDQDWPDGLEARHLCNNGHLACANPYHVIPGTRAENISDRPSMAGEMSSSAILTAGQVLTICERVDAGEKQRAVAASFGVNPQLVNKIVRGYRWTTVTGRGR